MLKKTFTHKLVILLCNGLRKLYNIFRLEKLFKKEKDLNLSYQYDLRYFATVEMQDFLDKQGPEFQKSLEEQNFKSLVPLNNTGNSGPSLNQLYPEQIDKINAFKKKVK